MVQEHSSIDAFPESIELTDDDSVLQIVSCCCAVCQGHHPSQSLNLKAEEFPGIRMTDIAPVGRYAYHIVWSDGHDTGIYTLKMLRELENSA
jgi:DUF971 family protein